MTFPIKGTHGNWNNQKYKTLPFSLLMLNILSYKLSKLCSSIFSQAVETELQTTQSVKPGQSTWLWPHCLMLKKCDPSRSSCPSKIGWIRHRVTYIGSSVSNQPCHRFLGGRSETNKSNLHFILHTALRRINKRHFNDDISTKNCKNDISTTFQKNLYFNNCTIQQTTIQHMPGDISTIKKRFFTYNFTRNQRNFGHLKIVFNYRQ